MLAIAFTFLVGRYHATPWGRHVNEASVAWPPDLWRITRALIAVWHRKLDPTRFPRELLQEVLARIAQAEAPSFHLPEAAIHAHTRHYMPGKNDKRSLVFDAFARIADDDPIVIAWPELELGTSQIGILDALLENLGYLGRAESWVEARRTAPLPSFNCEPTISTVNFETGEITGEIVRLMAPTQPEEYRAFRSRRLEDAGIGLDGHGNTPSNLKGDKRKLAVTLPNDWLSAISVDTGELQAAGWSAPPCARTVSYRRPLRALKTTAPRIVRKPTVIKSNATESTARFMVYGKPLPRVEDTVRIGEDVRAAAMGRAKRLLGSDAVPSILSGHDMGDNNRHAHAFWLPESNDRGEIEHIIVHAPGGFSAEATRALTALQQINRGQGEPLRVILEGFYTPSKIAGPSVLTERSSAWHSVTPYLHPWFLKSAQMGSSNAIKHAILGQLRREWHARNADLPDISEIDILPSIRCGGRVLRPLHFHRFRRKRGLVQPDTLGRLIEIRFAQPVWGPIALGFGCHFGLGLFAPAANNESHERVRPLTIDGAV